MSASCWSLRTAARTLQPESLPFRRSASSPTCSSHPSTVGKQAGWGQVRGEYGWRLAGAAKSCGRAPTWLHEWPCAVFLAFSEGSPGNRTHQQTQPMHFHIGAHLSTRDSPTLTCAPSLPFNLLLPSPFFPLRSSSCLARARAHTKCCAKRLTAAQRKSWRCSSADFVAHRTTPRTPLPTSPAQIKAQEAPNGVCFLPRTRAHARTCVCACMHGKMAMFRPLSKH